MFTQLENILFKDLFLFEKEGWKRIFSSVFDILLRSKLKLLKLEDKNIPALYSTCNDVLFLVLSCRVKLYIYSFLHFKKN